MPTHQAYLHSNNSQNSISSSSTVGSPDIKAALLDDVNKRDSPIQQVEHVSFAQKLLNLMNFYGNPDQKGESGSVMSNLARRLSLLTLSHKERTNIGSIYPSLPKVNSPIDANGPADNDLRQQKGPGPRRVVLIHDKPILEQQNGSDLNSNDPVPTTHLEQKISNEVDSNEKRAELGPAPQGNHRIPILDHFDADNEESFTLEPFDQLIQNAASNNKYFILAKVTTADPNDESRQYHSYYDAQQINKVLFRTQPEQSLLHRMRAKNPLNNMAIIGDVVYYIISHVSVQKSERKYKKKIFKVTLKSLLETLRKEHDHLSLEGEETLEQLKTAKTDEKKLLEKYLKMDVNSLPPEYFFQLHCMMNSENPANLNAISPKCDSALLKDNQNKLLDNQKFENESKVTEKFMSPCDFTRVEPKKDQSQRSSLVQSKLDEAMQNQRMSVSSVESLLSIYSSSASMTSAILSSPDRELINGAKEEYGEDAIYYKAHYYGTDDDFLMKGTVREFFKENAINAEDPVLFTLYRNDPSSRPGGANSHGNQNNAVGSTVGTNASANAAANAITRNTSETTCASACCGFLRGKSKSFRVIFSTSVAASYLGVAALILVFAIPESLKILVGIAFLCIFALIALVLADVNRYYSQQDAIANRQTRPLAVTATAQTNTPPTNSNMSAVPPV